MQKANINYALTQNAFEYLRRMNLTAYYQTRFNNQVINIEVLPKRNWQEAKNLLRKNIARIKK